MPNIQPSIPHKMQWFFLILVAIWILATLALTAVIFYFTKSPYSFTLFGGLGPPLYVIYRITHWLFPKNERDYELAEKRAQYAAEFQHNKKRVS